MHFKHLHFIGSGVVSPLVVYMLIPVGFGYIVSEFLKDGY